ncbi:class I SAM-dependent methyltransferase [Runella sp.]|uniref:class I SAM-dependent methyltransferase n=1 Tax=Runella sp. TaxID=1960881 RepID=UPI003D0D5DFD
MKNKIKYFLRSIKNYTTSKVCPYCGSTVYSIIDRKYLITTLNECKNCKLYYRHPTDTISFNKKFYQDDYEQKDGVTTDLPSDKELEVLLEQNFVGIEKDSSSKIEIINSFFPKSPINIVDFGANWGYTSYQFKKKGWNVQSYEISVPRAQFGNKLGLDIFTSVSELKAPVDVFFSSHVIEHLPDIKSMFLLAKQLVKSDGLFICYCPNGSNEFKEKEPENFHRLWGEVHPNYLNVVFFKNVFKDVPYLIGSNSSSIEEIKKWDMKSQNILDVSGIELFIYAQINNYSF